MLNKIELIGCYRSENPDFVVMIMERKGNKTIVQFTVDGLVEEYDIDLDDFVNKGIDIELWEWNSNDVDELIEIVGMEDVWDKLWEGIDSKPIHDVWE